jgi:hypothetical protein
VPSSWELLPKKHRVNANDLGSRWLRSPPRWESYFPPIWPHHCSSMCSHRRNPLPLLDNHACSTLYETDRAETVGSSPICPINPLILCSIIRILFMIPVYAIASFFSFWFYWHAIYFQVISDCYEAFAIASFFSLLCHYLAPTLHDQKAYFRSLQPGAWVMPISWMKSCFGGQRGCLRTPRSGLTWFNIIWVGIYQYCFIRVAMTVTAVLTQYFGRYCQSSDSPVFSHVWVCRIPWGSFSQLTGCRSRSLRVLQSQSPCTALFNFTTSFDMT